MVAPGFYDAPSPKRVTILFTFIERWRHLLNWSERNPVRKIVLADTKNLFNLYVRAALHAHGGYEVEGEDGCFVCAFGTPEEAVEFSVVLQRGLAQAVWKPEVLRSKHCKPIASQEGAVVLAGPRVKIGMCTADAEHAQPSPRTGKMEYFGPIMNHAARVASTAYGGQVLLHEATWEALDHDMLRSDIVLTACGRHRLKGMAKSIRITQASSPDCKQSFPRLGTSGDEDLQPMLEYLTLKGHKRQRARQKLGLVKRGGMLSSPTSKHSMDASSSEERRKWSMDNKSRGSPGGSGSLGGRSPERLSIGAVPAETDLCYATNTTLPVSDLSDGSSSEPTAHYTNAAERTAELPAWLRLVRDGDAGPNNLV